jgi:hypothetical protein
MVGFHRDRRRAGRPGLARSPVFGVAHGRNRPGEPAAERDDYGQVVLPRGCGIRGPG